MKFDRSKYSKCKNCPLRDNTRVFGQGSLAGKLAVIGEAPGAKEDLTGRPFAGPAGSWLDNGLRHAGVKRETIYCTNVICCRPPNNNMDSFEALEARQCCKPGFDAEIKFLKEHDIKILVPVGNYAVHALDIEGSISKVRGSVYETKYGLFAVPTYHPSFIMRGMVKEEVTWISDFDKARTLASSNYKVPKEKFILEPSYEQIIDFLRNCSSLLGVDVETTGLDPRTARITIMGIATSAEKAISIPFLREDYQSIWTHEQEDHIKKALSNALQECETVYQNALFDIPVLRHNGVFVDKADHDVMLAHHIVHPELRHDLGYIVSIYGKTPYWKDAPRKNFDRVYNLRDCVVLHQVLPELLGELRTEDTYHVYKECSMELVMPIIEMTDRGIKLSKSRLANWKKSLKAKRTRIIKNLHDIAELPEEFNLSSGDHLRYLLFGIEAKQFERAEKELKEYDKPDCKRKKNTLVYKKLAATHAVKTGTQVLYQVPGGKKTTPKGALSVDEEGLYSLENAARNRLDVLKALKKKKPAEQKNVQQLIDFLVKFRDYQKVAKLISTYTSFPVDANSRVHFSYKIHGTTTGRLSSGGKGDEAGNAQNIPEEARKMFIAEDGYTFINADYTNLELVILAFISDDDSAIEAFKKKINFHDQNTRDMFGIEPSNPQWSTNRHAMKTYRFGRNYGGSLKGIYDRVIKQVPDSNLTFAKFKEIDALYRRKHPNYAKWFDNITREVSITRTLVNWYGRKRYFLGTDSEIRREGANFPIQSGAADIINQATIKLHKELIKRKLDAYIVAQVHDALLVECKNSLVKKVSELMRSIMEAPVKITAKYTVSFPVEIKTGPSWGELHK